MSQASGSSPFPVTNFPTAEEVSRGADLTGKTAIVTGANTGIGWETARVLALRNCRVIITCRTAQKGEEARRAILQSIGADKAALVEVEELELGSLASIRAFADRFGKRQRRDLHILVNNAGLGTELPSPPTEDGFELHFGVNHLGTFLLTVLLLPYLRASAPARVIVVASLYHTVVRRLDVNNLTKRTNYAVSKLYNILFANELARRLQGTGITVNSLHPGVVYTDIYKGTEAEKRAYFENLSQIAGDGVLTTAQGAATSVFLAVSETGGSKTGEFFYGTEVLQRSEAAGNQEYATALWALSEKLTGINASRL